MTNNNDVIHARNFQDSALAAQLHLKEQYDLPPVHQDQKRIAGLHQAINYGLKQAEVSALLAIATELQALNQVPSFDQHVKDARGTARPHSGQRRARPAPWS